MQTTAIEPRLVPVIDRTVISPRFVARLFEDISRFGDGVQIHATDETGHILAVSEATIHEVQDGLANGRFKVVEFHYYYSGCMWCDRLCLGSGGLELIRKREWFSN